VRINPYNEAQRLIGPLDAALLPDLAEDPFTAIEVLFDGLTVVLRPPTGDSSECGIDGTYQPGPPPRIEVSNDVAPARQRFTALHELGHHLIELDEELNDLSISDLNRRDEAICNEVAASILLPGDLVDRVLTAGAVTAAEVLQLHDEAASASRAACCVAAVRRLHHRGCVLVGTEDGMVAFAAHHLATPWRIAPGTEQGSSSLLARAARDGHARGVTQLRFASGGESGEVHADAQRAGDGWIVLVAVIDAYSPWEKGLSFPTADDSAPRETVECPRCDHAFTAWWPPCKVCGDHRCPQCKKCSCQVTVTERFCQGCTMLRPESQFPGGGVYCVDCI